MDYIMNYDFSTSPKLTRRVRERLVRSTNISHNSSYYYSYYHTFSDTTYLALTEIQLTDLPVYWFSWNNIFFCSNTISQLKNLVRKYFDLPYQLDSAENTRNELLLRRDRIQHQINKLKIELDFINSYFNSENPSTPSYESPYLGDF